MAGELARVGMSHRFSFGWTGVESCNVKPFLNQVQLDTRRGCEDPSGARET